MIDHVAAREYIRASSEPVPWTGCWLWSKKSTFPRGYGSAWHKNKQWRAHRLSYEAFVGPIPEGYVVMHLCNNTACVNPEHLQVGTQSENVQYAYTCGRADRSGEHHHMHKLVEDDVLFIRYAASCGYRYNELATVLGVTPSTVEDVAHNRTWRNT